MPTTSSDGSQGGSVDEDTIEVKGEALDSIDGDEEIQSINMEGIKDEPSIGSTGSSPALQHIKLKTSRSTSLESIKSHCSDGSPVEQEEIELVGGDVTVKTEPGQPLKLARSASQKIAPRPPPLFNDLPDATDDAKSLFMVMDACTYSNKYLGYTEHAMECDCAEEWGKYICYDSF